MPQLAISEELANTITSAAVNRGCTPQQLLESIFAHVEDGETSPELAYTGSALAHIQDGIDQSLLGETIPQEEVEAFFEDWKRELRV